MSESNRHPSITSIRKWLTANPNLAKDQFLIAHNCEQLADSIIEGIPQDGPELTAGLRKLLEAKDCFVRASLDNQPVDYRDR
jgi:hypothetical protein